MSHLNIFLNGQIGHLQAPRFSTQPNWHPWMFTLAGGGSIEETKPKQFMNTQHTNIRSPLKAKEGYRVLRWLLYTTSGSRQTIRGWGHAGLKHSSSTGLGGEKELGLLSTRRLFKTPSACAAMLLEATQKFFFFFKKQQKQVCENKTQEKKKHLVFCSPICDAGEKGSTANRLAG